MPTATLDNTTTAAAAAYAAVAARFCILAVEADIQALMAIRTDPEKAERTEGTYRGLIIRQARYRRHATNLEKLVAAGQVTQECALLRQSQTSQVRAPSVTTPRLSDADPRCPTAGQT
jgi:hypothetical protein